MPMGAALGRLVDLAEAQNGLVTTRQADHLDVARRDLAQLAASGGLERVGHGVYRVAGAPRPRLLELRAAWLQLAPGVPVDERRAADGVISHASAALVYQVGLLDPPDTSSPCPASGGPEAAAATCSSTTLRSQTTRSIGWRRSWLPALSGWSPTCALSRLTAVILPASSATCSPGGLRPGVP